MRCNKKNTWIIYGWIITILIAGIFIKGSFVYATESDKEESAQNKTEQVYSEENGVVFIQLVLENTGEVVHSGTGFFIGTESQHYILTSKNIVTLTKEEINSYAISLEVEEDRINTSIRVITSNGVQWTATSVDGTDNQKFDILSISGSVGAVSSLRLAEEYSMDPQQIIHVLSFYNNEETNQEGIIEDWSTNSEGEKIFIYNSLPSDIEPGSPVMNVYGTVQGICVKGTDGSIQILQICEVIEVLSTLGIQYNENIVLDTTALEEAIALYESLDEADYKEESWTSSVESYERAKELLDLSNSGVIYNGSQDEVNALAEELNADIENMDKAGPTVMQVIWIAVIVIGMVISVCVAVVIIVIKRNKKSIESIKESQIKAVDQVLKRSGRVTLGEVFNTACMPVNRSLAEVQGEEILETTVLSLVPTDEQRQSVLKEQSMPPCLIRKKTGEKVYINGHSFIIGKSKDQADFYIADNSNISRTHACIKMMPDGYYLQDLNATNGTYVDGLKVKWERDIKLQDGCIIRLADEELIFEWH